MVRSPSPEAVKRRAHCSGKRHFCLSARRVITYIPVGLVNNCTIVIAAVNHIAAIGSGRINLVGTIFRYIANKQCLIFTESCRDILIWSPGNFALVHNRAKRGNVIIESVGFIGHKYGDRYWKWHPE